MRSRDVCRHLLFHAHEYFVDRLGAGERAGQDEMREILLILQRIGLRQHPAVGMSQQTDLIEVERLAHTFDILHHVLDGVAGRILQGLRAPEPRSSIKMSW